MSLICLIRSVGSASCVLGKEPKKDYDSQLCTYGHKMGSLFDIHYFFVGFIRNKKLCYIGMPIKYYLCVLDSRYFENVFNLPYPFLRVFKFMFVFWKCYVKTSSKYSSCKLLKV